MLLWLDRRFRLGYGRVFALYVMIYTAGRGWIETLRIDTIELNNVLGLRWGVWMSIVLFVRAAVVLRGDRSAAPPAATPRSPRRTSTGSDEPDEAPESSDGGPMRPAEDPYSRRRGPQQMPAAD